MNPKIKVFQTADAENYAELIRISSEANRRYCDRHSIEFELYLGIKRGCFPWHAAFNRIIYLKEQVDAGYDGWILYLDADAFIFGQGYDIRELAGRGDGDFYFAPGGLTGQKWDVNSGVFIINLGSTAGCDLVEAWYAHFMQTPEEELNKALDWGMVAADQERLHEILMTRPDFLEHLAIVPREILNDEHGSFIRQVLRSNASSLEERIDKLKTGVTEATSGRQDEVKPFGSWSQASALANSHSIKTGQLNPNIKVFQTADAENYAELIRISSEANRRYCDRHSIEFELYLGIKRGCFPWHATFNRIIYLKEQVDAGYDGWILYLDADAFIFGQGYDIRELAGRGDGDFYFAPGGLTGQKWDVNAGVFIINLGSTAGCDLVEAWYAHFMQTPEEELNKAPDWGMVADDQERLHEILRARPDFLESLAMVPREILNDERGSFIRQVLRTAGKQEKRIEKLKAGVKEAVSGRQDEVKPFDSCDEASILDNSYKDRAARESELRALLGKYGAEAKSFLAWGAGGSARTVLEFAGEHAAEVFLDMEEGAEDLHGLSDLDGKNEFFQVQWEPRSPTEGGANPNYLTYPLTLGRTFDFILIKGDTKIECALMALIVAGVQSVIVFDDYEHAAMQPLMALFGVVEDGSSFRVMTPRPTVFPHISEVVPQIIASMKALGRAEETRAPFEKKLLRMPANEALGLAHRYAIENELPAATAMAELALSQPDGLGEGEVNARVLLASLRERQRDFDAAMLSIDAAVRLDPDNQMIKMDRERILAARLKQC